MVVVGDFDLLVAAGDEAWKPESGGCAEPLRSEHHHVSDLSLFVCELKRMEMGEGVLYNGR